jgi:hypothetical protein
MEALPARDTGQARGKAQDAGWRGSPEGRLEAAYEALKESGILLFGSCRWPSAWAMFGGQTASVTTGPQ